MRPAQGRAFLRRYRGMSMLRQERDDRLTANHRSRGALSSAIALHQEL